MFQNWQNSIYLEILGIADSINVRGFVSGNSTDKKKTAGIPAPHLPAGSAARPEEQRTADDCNVFFQGPRKIGDFAGKGRTNETERILPAERDSCSAVCSDTAQGEFLTGRRAQGLFYLL